MYHCLRLVLGQDQGKSCVHHCCGRSRSGRKGGWSEGLRASSSFQSPHHHHPPTSCPQLCFASRPEANAGWGGHTPPAGTPQPVAACGITGHWWRQWKCPQPWPGATPVLHQSHKAIPVPVATAQDFLATELFKPPVGSPVTSVSTPCTSSVVQCAGLPWGVTNPCLLGIILLNSSWWVFLQLPRAQPTPGCHRCHTRKGKRKTLGRQRCLVLANWFSCESYTQPRG